MDLNSLKDVYIHLLRDLYSAENQLLKALPKMARAVNNPELQKGFQQHTEQTREQAQRIEQICSDLGVKPSGKKCEAMAGLIAEGEEALKEKGDPASKDAAIIVDAQKIEHYEIAGYGSARAFAEHLGFSKHVRLLERTLNEEKKTDERLNKVALKNVNQCALEEGEDEEEASGSRAKSGGKATSSKSKSASAKSSSKSSASRSSKASGSSSRSSTSAKSAGSSAKSSGSKSASKSGGSSKGSSSKSASGSKSGKSGSKSSGSSKSSDGNSGNVTTDHEEIRQWVEQRGGTPACVKGTGNKGDIGLLRIDYPGYSGEETLQPIEWDEFFEKFEEQKLAFLHQDETADGKQSRFSKLISRSNSK